MRRKPVIVVAALAILTSLAPLNADEIRGQVVDQSGVAIEGVMVSARDEDHRQTTSAFSHADGS